MSENKSSIVVELEKTETKGINPQIIAILFALIFLIFIVVQLNSETSVKNQNFIKKVCETKPSFKENWALLNKDNKITNQEYLIFMYILNVEMENGK